MTRTLSAIVMVAVAGTALWLGGWVFTAFVVAVGLGVLWEWWGLVRRIAKTPIGAAVWMVAGVSYVAVAMAMLVAMRNHALHWGIFPILMVIAVDVGAYFAGRSIGGPKIAPSVSPSKTWAGFVGGALVAAFAYYLFFDRLWDLGLADNAPYPTVSDWLFKSLMAGILIAIIAQSGDFFESWMKRRAGVKDSGSLIPGHGGLFDRVDGLLAVLFVGGVVWLVTS